MDSSHRRRKHSIPTEQPPPPPSVTPEWLERVRLTVEKEGPLVRALLQRSIIAVLRFADLSESSIEKATTAPTDLAVLVSALSSSELLDELRAVEPLAPAFIRGIQAQRRLLDEHGGTLSAAQIGEILGITPQAVDKRRQSHSLLALNMGRHGYRYPVWQFTESGALPGLKDVLQALHPHDEWMQIAFFVSKNPRLHNQTPIDMLKAGELDKAVDAARAYGEHGAA
jgi:hypothetical protein